VVGLHGQRRIVCEVLEDRVDVLRVDRLEVAVRKRGQLLPRQCRGARRHGASLSRWMPERPIVLRPQAAGKAVCAAGEPKPRRGIEPSPCAPAAPRRPSPVLRRLGYRRLKTRARLMSKPHPTSSA
jgi:hypothetical protein